MSKIEGGFSLIALLDGTTINGTLRVEGMPFVQRYKTGSEIFYPDLSTSSDIDDTDRPTAVILLRNLATGAIMIPTDYSWYYNGVTMTFKTVTDEGTYNGKKMCDNILGNNGEYLFELLEGYTLTIGNNKYYLPAIRVWGNLVPLSSGNNDLLSASGSVELNGQTIQFKDLNLTIVIQEEGGSNYALLLTDNLGGAITDRSQEMTITCSVFESSTKQTDLNAYSFKWYKMLGTGDEEMAEVGNTIGITIDDIDSLLKIRVDAYKDGAYIASATYQVADNTDEYYIDFSFTGITGNSIRSGETVTITPIMRKRSDGSNVTLVKTWDWSLYKNDGSNFKTVDDAASISLGYSEVVSCGGGVSGSVSGTY